MEIRLRVASLKLLRDGFVVVVSVPDAFPGIVLSGLFAVSFA
jgi:hypothetical protein